MKRYTKQELIVFAENPKIKSLQDKSNSDNHECIFLSNDCIPRNINLRKVFKKLIQPESYKYIHYSRFETGYVLSLNLGFPNLSINDLTEYFFSIISKKDRLEYDKFPEVFVESLYWFIMGFKYARDTRGVFIIQSLDDIICDIGYKKIRNIPNNFKLNCLFLRHVRINIPELVFKDLEFSLSRIAFKLGFLLKLHEKKVVIRDLNESFFHVLFMRNFITESENYTDDILDYYEWFKLGCGLSTAISFIG